MRRLQQFAPDFIILALLFLLPLGFFYQQTLGGRTLIPTENLYQYEPYYTYRDVVRADEVPHNHLVSDLILQNYQWKHFTRQQLSQGEIPLWNPHQFAGIPFLAAGQHSALYPLSIIYYIIDLPYAYGWFTVVNLWLAGALMYGFMRSLGLHPAAAMLAGVVYQFNGFVIASVVFQMMIGGIVWLPLLLMMVEFIVREQPAFGKPTLMLWVVLGAAALGMNIYAGHVEITIYTLLIAGYYAAGRLLVRLWQQYRLRRTKAATIQPAPPVQLAKSAFWLVVMVALGFGLGALQFIPLFEFVQTNYRAERNDYETVVSFAHPLRDVVQFALPNFYGNPAHQQIFDVFNFEMVRDWATPTNQPHTDWGIKNYVEAALYVGILPLLLAGYALLDRWLLWRNTNTFGRVSLTPEPPYRLIFVTLGILSLTFMFGLPTYRLIYILPGINQLNSPFRWIYGVTLCVAVLAAFGLDALIRRGASVDHKTTKRIGYAVVATAMLVLIGLVVSRVFFPSFEPLVNRLWRGLANATNAFSDASLFYSYQFINLLIFGGVLLASGAVFWWAGRMRAFKRVNGLATLAVMLVAVDLMIASWGFNPASDPLLLDFEPPAVQWLREQAQTETFRITTLEDVGDRPILNANSGWMYGLYDVRGYDSIIPKQYMDYMRAIAPQVQALYNRVAPMYAARDYNHSGGYNDALTSPLFNLLNIRYVMAHPSTEIYAPGWWPVYQDEAVRIWYNDNAMPRAYTVPVDNFDAAWLTPPDMPVDYAALQTPSTYDAVHIRADSGREKFIDLTLDEETWLIVSESYAAGWRAFVRPLGAGDDAPEEVYAVQRVFGNFQGVLLPAGDWTIRLIYSPASFQVGLFGTVISIALMVFMVGVWFWRSYVGLNSADSSTTARVARNSLAPIILNLFNRGIDFAFAIVMLRILDQESVGVYNFAIVVFVWFDIFTNFGLDVFLMREVSKAKARGGYFFFNTSFLRLLLSIMGLPLLLVFLFLWQNGVSEPLPAEGLIALLLLYAGLFPASLSKGMTSVFYAHEQAEKPAAIATITTINKAVFGVIALLLGYGIVGLAAVSIANNVLTLFVLVYTGRQFIRRNGQQREADTPPSDTPSQPTSGLMNPRLMRHMVGESWPLMLNHFLATIFFQVDIVILQALKGAQIVAQYSTSYKWLLAINIVPAFFTQALFPVLSRQAEQDKVAFLRSYRLGIKLLLALSLPLAVGFTVLADVLTLILAGPSYLPNAAIALQLMIWSIPIGWMNSLTQYALIALNLQRYITWAFFGAVSFNIVVNLIFIPQFNFQAAAIATIASEAVLLLPFGILMQRGLQLRIGWFDLVWRPIVATGVMVAIIAFGWIIQPVVALVAGSVAYGVVLLALRPLDDGEIAMLPSAVRVSRLGRWVFRGQTQQDSIQMA